MAVRTLILAAILLTVAQGDHAASMRSAAGSSPQKGSSKATGKRRPAADRKPLPPRAEAAAQAAARSTDLRPLAAQLLNGRTVAAYAAVEDYAADHATDPAGALAWLVAGYALILDGEYRAAATNLEKAQLRAGELGDYVDYFLALAYGNSGQPAQAAKALDGFGARYPESLFKRDAAQLHAESLKAIGKSREAIAILEGIREPASVQVELDLGQSYAQAGRFKEAVEALRRVYYGWPASTQAKTAEQELESLGRTQKLPPPTRQQRKQRADLLLEARQYAEAISAYRELTREAQGAEHADAQLDLARALFKARKYADARKVLVEIEGLTAEANAERLFYLTEIRSDPEAYLQYLGELRRTASDSPWLQQALLSAGNRHLLQNNMDAAARFYYEGYQRLPDGPKSSYMLWKSAWLSYRLDRLEEAGARLEELIGRYPEAMEVSAALYWRGRVLEKQNNLPRARAFYQRVSDRYRYFYYAGLARERLVEIGIDGAAPPDALLKKIARPEPPVRMGRSAMPAEEVRAHKARLLQNGALDDFAIRELQVMADGGSDWAAGEIVRLYQLMGRHYRALQVAKKSLPGYFSREISDLPRNVWEALFPRLYWEEIQRFAEANGLDPYLVASIIRQESEFRPDAVSRARAIGLMQLLPSTGRKVARELKLRPYSTAKLRDPKVNLQLGTKYFRDRLEEFGRVEYALASYNAGPDRVTQWLANGPYRDAAEFVESIPFTETREYVQAIQRNVSVYRRLYGDSVAVNSGK
ncbi:MAG TPA: transglycosylase SLT domain-containing protein [Terriglobales bacterium]|nr:transglycosylase SLT domain-containing protein [Terriglobales bacterium]